MFNMIPVAPLDGSQIFSGYLMRKSSVSMEDSIIWSTSTFGLILFGYVTGFSILWLIMRPFVEFFMTLFIGSVI